MAHSVAGDEIEVTVLLPCLNEAETLEICVTKAVRALAELGVVGEVLVSDNGSTDGSQEIATRAGARVSHAPIRGYGGALLNGIEQARGKYIIMGDADDSYDLSNLEPFIRRTARRARHGHGQPVPRRHRQGRDAAAAPLPRQPGALLAGAAAVRAAQRRRLPLRHPGLQPGPHPGPAALHAGHGVRLRAGGAGRAQRVRHRRGADHPAARTAAAGRRTCVPGGTAGATCASCSSSPRARR